MARIHCLNNISKKGTDQKGIHVKTGVARDVKFVTKVGAFDYGSVPDRVVWGQGAFGADAKRVVSVTVEPVSFEIIK